MKITTRPSFLIILLLQYLFQTSLAKPHCTSSACGIIPNITPPFRLKGDPNHCGDGRLELVCENNVTSFYLNSHKYYVKAINYTTHTFRLVDASIDNHTCSFPNKSAYRHHFTLHPHADFLYPNYDARAINFLSCPYPLKNSPVYTNTTHCHSSDSRFTYIKVGRLIASEVKHMCRVEVIVMSSWKFEDSNNVSPEEIHVSLLYGFELLYCPQCRMSRTLWGKFLGFFLGPTVVLWIFMAIVVFISAGISLPVMIVVGFTSGLLLLFISIEWIPNWRNSLSLIFARDWAHGPLLFSGSMSAFIFVIVACAPRFIICPFVFWILIYKFRRRHLSVFEAIETFLQSDNNLMPIRYSYSDITKMTKGFRDKLGEGGYGSVYKGKLRSGHHVAVKLLGKSGANGQDFMNEIATIGRIHHVNVVKLVGYCAQGSKRALVFDFMPNGSLEKYIFNTEKSDYLNWDTKFDIAVGVARGIEYLHRGCNVQILHFDIKPHNILLDDKFIPKISDFGLAKFCSTKKNTMTLTAARGTIGYVAPELINRSLGRISNKADVYSFGMLLMEIVRLKRDLTGDIDGSSKYFPCWIYDCFNEGKDIEIAKVVDDSTRKLARKMTIVALWCIQMSPDDRPPMNKVLEMLEGDVERLQLPHYPSQSTEILINEDQTGITCSTDSISLLHHDNNLSLVQITVQE